MADASPIADAALNDATLLVALRELIQPNKLEELSMKKVMKALRETFGDGVRARKPWILEQVTAIVQGLGDSDSDGDGGTDGDGGSGSDRDSDSDSEDACPLLGNGVTNDTLLHIASFLTARDLLCLGLTCLRFAAKIIGAPTGGADAAAAEVAAPEMLSIVEEAARRWVVGCTDQERGWMPRCELESWLFLMDGVEMLRLPLAFDRAHRLVTLSENSTLANFTIVDDAGHVIAMDESAASQRRVMRAGRHYAQFTLEAGDNMLCGVVRPDWDVDMMAGGSDAGAGSFHATSQPGHCFYWSVSGERYAGPTDGHDLLWDEDDDDEHVWEAQQSATTGDSIGLLLDIDQGSMTVYKNGERLAAPPSRAHPAGIPGVMMPSGLSGEYCWAVLVQKGVWGIGNDGQGVLLENDETDEIKMARVRIASAPAPASPTEDELAAAMQWELVMSALGNGYVPEEAHL